MFDSFLCAGKSVSLYQLQAGYPFSRAGFERQPQWQKKPGQYAQNFKKGNADPRVRIMPDKR